jgi:hypothetical protein
MAEDRSKHTKATQDALSTQTVSFNAGSVQGQMDSLAPKLGLSRDQLQVALREAVIR